MAKRLSEKEAKIEARRNLMRASAAQRAGNEERAEVYSRRCDRFTSQANESTALLALAGDWGKQTRPDIR
jgi:hypothetical protein